MSRLTVTEKEHWKARIERRIQKAIDVLTAKDPRYFTEVKEKAEQQAHAALGTLELSNELTLIKNQIDELSTKKTAVECDIYSKALGIPPNRANNCWANESQFKSLLSKRSEVIEQELLAASDTGLQLLRLAQEKEAILDTIWLATSNKQIRDLWGRVASVVGDDATNLQAEIMASAEE